jgi:hypothetical protein
VGRHQQDPTTLQGYGITDALPLKPLLGAKVDLDDIISTGWYHQSLSINAASGSNYPTPTAGMLSVYAAGSMVYQHYLDYQGKRRWWRVKYNDDWSTWAGCPTLDELHAYADRVGNMQSTVPMVGNMSLLPATTGSFIEATGTGGYTLTLPSTTGISASAYAIYNNCPAAITVSAARGQNINLGLSNVATFSLPPGGTAWVVTDGVSWSIIAGTVAGIGGNQTWQTPIRTAGTTYYNTTGRPIAISLALYSNASGLGTFYVNGAYVAEGGGNGVAAVRESIFTIVPPGASYQFNVSGSLNIESWAELR